MPQPAQAVPRYVVIGIGINIGAARRPTACRTPPAWLRELAARRDRAPRCCGESRRRWCAPCWRFATHGFAPFAARFAARDALRGREVHLSDGTSGQCRRRGRDGALLVRRAGGVMPVTSSEVSVRPQARRN